MTNKQLVDCVAVKAGLTKKASEEAVKAVFEVIAEALKAKEDVKLVGFGNFVTRTKSQKTGRNPATGEQVIIPEKDVVKFKASKNLLVAE